MRQLLVHFMFALGMIHLVSCGGGKRLGGIDELLPSATGLLARRSASDSSFYPAWHQSGGGQSHTGCVNLIGPSLGSSPHYFNLVDGIQSGIVFGSQGTPYVSNMNGQLFALKWEPNGESQGADWLFRLSHKAAPHGAPGATFATPALAYDGTVFMATGSSHIEVTAPGFSMLGVAPAITQPEGGPDPARGSPLVYHSRYTGGDETDNSYLFFSSWGSEYINMYEYNKNVVQELNDIEDPDMHHEGDGQGWIVGGSPMLADPLGGGGRVNHTPAAPSDARANEFHIAGDPLDWLYYIVEHSEVEPGVFRNFVAMSNIFDWRWRRGEGDPSISEYIGEVPLSADLVNYQEEVLGIPTLIVPDVDGVWAILGDNAVGGLTTRWHFTLDSDPRLSGWKICSGVAVDVGSTGNPWDGGARFDRLYFVVKNGFGQGMLVGIAPLKLPVLGGGYDPQAVYISPEFEQPSMATPTICHGGGDGTLGTVYVSAKHRLYSFQPSGLGGVGGGTMTSSPTLGYDIVSSPAVGPSPDGSTQMLFVGADNGTVYAFGSPIPLSAPWPQFGHDPQHTRRSSTQGAPFTGPSFVGEPDPAGHDQVLVAPRPGIADAACAFGAPCVDEQGLVFFQTSDSTLHCLSCEADPLTGILEWESRFTSPNGSTEPFPPMDGKNHVGSSPAVSRTMYYDASRILDEDPLDPVPSLRGVGTEVYAAVHDGSVFFAPHSSTAHLTPHPYLLARDTEGELLWAAQLGNAAPEDSFIFSSPTIAPDGTLYIGTYTDDGSAGPKDHVYAFDPWDTDADGFIAPKWVSELVNPVSSSPAIGTGGALYVATTEDPVSHAGGQLLQLSSSSGLIVNRSRLIALSPPNPPFPQQQTVIHLYTGLGRTSLGVDELGNVIYTGYFQGTGLNGAFLFDADLKLIWHDNGILDPAPYNSGVTPWDGAAILPGAPTFLTVDFYHLVGSKNINPPYQYSVFRVDSLLNQFKIQGSHTAEFQSGERFEVKGTLPGDPNAGWHTTLESHDSFVIVDFQQIPVTVITVGSNLTSDIAAGFIENRGPEETGRSDGLFAPSEQWLFLHAPCIDADGMVYTNSIKGIFRGNAIDLSGPFASVELIEDPANPRRSSFMSGSSISIGHHQRLFVCNSFGEVLCAYAD